MSGHRELLVYKKKKKKKKRYDWDSNVFKVSAISIALSQRWMPDGIYSRRSWNQWIYHVSAFEINGIHGNLSVFRQGSEGSKHLHLWFWLTCQMLTELGQMATLAPLWLAPCPAALHSGTVSPLNVIITHNPGVPLSPFLLQLFTNQPFLVLSLFDTLWLYFL